jgi:hypothetical protein
MEIADLLATIQDRGDDPLVAALSIRTDLRACAEAWSLEHTLDLSRDWKERAEKAEARPCVEICLSNRALGRGGCGACALCCKELRERAEKAEAERDEAHARVPNLAPPEAGEIRKCLVCAHEKPWGVFSNTTGAAVCVDCRDARLRAPIPGAETLVSKIKELEAERDEAVEWIGVMGKKAETDRDTAIEIGWKHKERAEKAEAALAACQEARALAEALVISHEGRIASLEAVVRLLVLCGASRTSTTPEMADAWAAAVSAAEEVLRG